VHLYMVSRLGAYKRRERALKAVEKFQRDLDTATEHNNEVQRRVEHEQAKLDKVNSAKVCVNRAKKVEKYENRISDLKSQLKDTRPAVVGLSKSRELVKRFEHIIEVGPNPPK